MKAGKIYDRIRERFTDDEQLYVCIQDLYMKNGPVAFKKGKIYALDENGNATSSEVTKEGHPHYLSPRNLDVNSEPWTNYFIKLKA